MICVCKTLRIVIFYTSERDQSLHNNLAPAADLFTAGAGHTPAEKAATEARPPVYYSVCASFSVHAMRAFKPSRIMFHMDDVF